MARGEPQHKGTGLRPVVEGLRANPEARRLVPKDLWHYLEDPILPSGWYPERHFSVLVEALASTIDAKAAGGNVWQFLGRTAALRDLGAEQDSAPPSLRSSSSGIYRQFVKNDASDPGAFFLRAKKIWQLYHDTGELHVLRRAGAPSTVVFRLEGHRFTVRGLEDLQGAYFLEFARLSGFSIRSSRTRGWDPTTLSYEWEYELESRPEIIEWIAALPAA